MKIEICMFFINTCFYKSFVFSVKIKLKNTVILILPYLGMWKNEILGANQWTMSQ